MVTPDPDELAQAMARLALGDRAALRRVYELTHRHLLGVAARLLGRADLAEEVLQEVYVAVWQRAESWRGDATPMGWLLALVRHRAIDLRRSRPASGLETQAEPLDEALPDESTGLLDAALARARIGECMAALAGPQRQSLALAYYGGLTHAEVATRLAVPLGTAKTWLTRGLARLRDCLEAAA